MAQRYSHESSTPPFGSGATRHLLLTTVWHFCIFLLESGTDAGDGKNGSDGIMFQAVERQQGGAVI